MYPDKTLRGSLVTHAAPAAFVGRAAPVINVPRLKALCEKLVFRLIPVRWPAGLWNFIYILLQRIYGSRIGHSQTCKMHSLSSHSFTVMKVSPSFSDPYSETVGTAVFGSIRDILITPAELSYGSH